MDQNSHSDNATAAPTASCPADSNAKEVAFWNVNVPPHLHTVECPEFLQYAKDNDKERAMLAIPDSEFQRQTWQDVRQAIDENRIDSFRRLPSDMRRYREYNAKLTKDYGSVMEFVMQERLKWDDLTPKGEPFSDPKDIKTLYNDWPYGIDPRIVHLVVWTKFELKPAPISASNPEGDITPETRSQIQDYVDRIFVSVCGTEQVLWFKNWSSLKSIHAVEHFHVLLFDPDIEFVRKITGGDVPLGQETEKLDESK